jgi:hypothetical protein
MTRSPAPLAPDLPPDALALLHQLAAARVEHILVVVPARFARNLERLSSVLRAVHAEWRLTGAGAAQQIDLSPSGLRRLGRWPLRGEQGDLEIDFEPPATAGHLDLFEGARRIAVRSGLEVEVASLADLRRIAEMRRGPADLVTLQTLEAQRPVMTVSASL